MRASTFTRRRTRYTYMYNCENELFVFAEETEAGTSCVQTGTGFGPL